VNLGTGEEIRIKELAYVIAGATGFDGDIVWDTSKPNGQPRRKLDTTRAKELFGFEAKTPFREGIARTVAWYREHASAYAGR
jgi:GDP-L-fucose synthase